MTQKDSDTFDAAMDNAAATIRRGEPDSAPESQGTDPNDVIRVPNEMSPAEVDARGDAVNAMRKEKGLPVPRTHDEDRGASYA